MALEKIFFIIDQILSSETILPNKKTFDRNHLLKVPYKDCLLSPGLLTNMTAIVVSGWSISKQKILSFETAYHVHNFHDRNRQFLFIIGQL
jgi:streptomycin 6-kinase